MTATLGTAANAKEGCFLQDSTSMTSLLRTRQRW
jgi:hypothetical protein